MDTTKANLIQAIADARPGTIVPVPDTSLLEYNALYQHAAVKAQEKQPHPYNTPEHNHKVGALAVQVGGGHYNSKAIQPIEYIHANNLNFIEGSVVKYITRWREKGGKQDLEKIKHYVDLLIDLEKL